MPALMNYYNPSGNNRFVPVMRQTKRDDGGQAQLGHSNLDIGGLLSMISPASDTFK